MLLKLAFWKKKPSKKGKKQKKKAGPWDDDVKPKKSSGQSSFGSYATNSLQSIGTKVTGPFGELSQKKIHIRALRKAKRALATIYFFLFFLMSLVTLSNIPIFLGLLGASYLMADYLWKTRKIVDWEKTK